MVSLADPHLLGALNSLTRPFWFLRHGESVFNKARIFQGQMDVELNETGHAQAARASEALRDAPFTRIVASPLRRAHDTALAVAGPRAMSVETDPALMECNLGVHQGKPQADWLPDYWRGAFQPEGGEDFFAFRARVIPAIVRHASTNEPTLIVVHGGLWYAMRSLVTFSPDIRSMHNAWPLLVTPRDGPWLADPLADRDLLSTSGGDAGHPS